MLQDEPPVHPSVSCPCDAILCLFTPTPTEQLRVMVVVMCGKSQEVVNALVGRWSGTIAGLRGGVTELVCVCE